MNQIAIGQYIALKRKKENLTQAQLAERIGVSNKTVSKWENGNCMPDYSIIEDLCKELKITVAELMDGEDSDENSIRMYDNERIVNLLRRTQELEANQKTMYGIVLIVMGIAMLAISQIIGGSNFRDFIAGVLLGLSIVEMLVGVYCVGCRLHKN